MLAVLCALVAASEWLVRRTALRHLGTAMLVIVVTAAVANLGLIPTGTVPHPLYEGIFAHVAYAALFLLLLDVNLGRVLAGPLEEARLLIWGKHAIPMEREQRSSQNIRVESVWMMRGPEPAEAAAGVLQARNRVVLDARALEREMDMSEGPYRATLEVRNEVRSETVPDWHPGPMPDAVRERFREVYNDMRLEVATGVRR